MEKQDVNRAARTIRSLMRERKYKEVVKMARNLKLDRINNGLLVLDIVEAYEHLGEKKEAKNTLMNYYDVHGITGRNMMQKLIELCIETGDINNAVGLCMEFENEWPESSISYLMRYQITTSAEGSLEERIYYLEKYKDADFEERWGYELAKLYHKNDQQEECAAVCHELICFFGHGKYVEKAVQLKEKTTGLSDDEIAILDAVKRREEEARLAREEAQRKAREEEERLAREEEERLAREEEERLAREEAQRLAREEERLAREEAERFAAEEALRLKQAEQVRLQNADSIRNGWGESESVQWAEWENTNNAESMENAEAMADTAARKSYEAEQEKIRQTEEAARLLKEKREEEKAAREQKIAQAFKTSDRYAQVEKNKAERIYFEELSIDTEEKEPKQKPKRSQQSGIFSSFGRIASDFKKTLQPDDEYLEETSGEIEYITIGRDSQAYVEDIEERMLSELDMLDDEQLDSLTSGQIKEIYELKVLRDVRENIKNLIVDTDNSYKTGKPAQELEKFVKSDPYPNPVNLGEQEDDEAEDNLAEEVVKDTVEEEAVEETIAEDTVEEEIVEETIAEDTVEEKNVEETIAEDTAEEKAVEETIVEDAVEEETVEETIVEDAVEEEIIEETIAEDAVEEEAVEEAIIEDSIVEESAADHSKVEKIPENGIAETAAKEETASKTSTSKETEVEAASETTVLEPDAAENKNTEAEEIVSKADTSEKSVEENTENKIVEEAKPTILDKIEDPDADLPVTEFIECITAYASTKGYQVEEMAYMTIAVLAEEMQQQKAPLSLNNAKKMADDAIVRAQKRNPLDKIMDRYSKKRAYILKDKHFYWNPEKG